MNQKLKDQNSVSFDFQLQIKNLTFSLYKLHFSNSYKMLLKNYTEGSSLIARLFIICITIYAVSATSSPLYGKSKNFYVGSNQASLTTSDVQDYQVSLPTDFIISSIVYRKPFFTLTQVQHLRINGDWVLYFWTRIIAFTSTGFTFQIENYVLLDQSITDPEEKFNKRLDQWGFITFTIVKYRYLVIKDSFPTIYFSKELDLITSGTYVQGKSYFEKIFTLSQLTSPDPSPLVLDDYDTVFIHSFANAKFYDQNSLKSFGIQFSFVVKSTDTFMVKFVSKYKTWSRDFHVNIFIYNKKDFLNLKIKIYSTLMTFNSLLPQANFKLVQYYTPPLSPAVDDILYGLSGFDFSGYERIGWQIAIDSTITNNHYKFTLINLITTSAIPKIQITINVIGQFQCSNGQLLINEVLDTCYSNEQNCPTGTMNSNVEVGKTGIMICKQCAPTCETCQDSVSKCLSCYVQQNRQLNVNSCVPVAHFYDDGTTVAKACHGTCNSCSVSSTSCDSCYSNQNRELIGKTCKPLSGYFEDGNDVAPKCDSNCLECITTATTCTSCVAGKYLSSQTCLPCVWPCATCSDAIQCKTCVTGLTQTGCSCTCSIGQFLNYTGSQCSSCSVAMTGCQECDTSTHCTKCSVGYYLNSGSTCTKCKPGCINCNDLECLKCKDYLTLTQGSCYCSSGFYFQDESISCKPCHKAIQNRQTCNSSTACTNCLNGSHLAPYGKSCLLDSQISQFFLASSPGQIQTCKDVSTILIVTFGVGIGLLVVIITTLVVCCLNAQAAAAKKRRLSESQQGRTDNPQSIESMKEIKSSVTRLNAVQLPGEV